MDYKNNDPSIYLTELLKEKNQGPAACKMEEHGKSIDLYCLSCNCTVCAKCLKNHKKHSDRVVDIEEEFEECLTSTKNLSSSLRHFVSVKHTQKEAAKENFDQRVEDKYNSELSKISQHFRNLHDVLHQRETTLKSSLQKHFEENKKVLTETEQKIQEDVEKSQMIIAELDKLKDVNQKTVDKDFKCRVISHHTASMHLINEEKQNQLAVVKEKEKEKDKEKFIKPTFKEPIMTIEDVLTSLEVKNTDKIYKMVYIYGNAGFQRLNLTSKKLEYIDMAGDKLSTTHGIFKSMVATQENIFIFKRNNYLKYDPTLKKWRMGTFPSYNGGDWQSVEYDGKEYIYLFGGCIDGLNHRDINRFNVRTETLDVEFSQTRLPIRFQTTCIVDDHIYTVGGVKQNNSEKEAVLERFNVNTKETKRIRNLQDDGYIDITAMVYIPSQNSIFMLNREHQFFKYDVKADSITQLPQVVQNVQQFYNRLAYDNDNTIYCISKDALHEYNIRDNIWSRVHAPKFHAYELYVFGICYTNKF